MNKIYQVVYCDARCWKKTSWDIALTGWHVLDCPLIGIERLSSARQSAQGLKKTYKTEVEVLIISNKNTKRRDADYLYGIRALRGAKARQDAPSYVLGWKTPLWMAKTSNSDSLKNSNACF